MQEESRLRLALAQRVLVADGAMGTMLQAAGLEPGTPPELWNRERPEAVRAVHAAYVRAGAEVILTNTFGGTRIKLARFGLDDQVSELNRLAAHLAREEAGPDRFVFGDVSSTGALLEPLGPLSFSQARDAFAEQAEALATGGVDAILVETMLDAQEARAAIQGAHQACALPVACTLSFGPGARTVMGAGPAQLADLWQEGLILIGANCGHTLQDTLTAITQLRDLLPEAPLMAKPNAGVPVLGEDGRTHFNVGPEEMASFAARYLDVGVRVIGGCCGSTPEHIAAIARTARAHSQHGGRHA
ncbi:MAG: hypothetical protein HPY83_06930 [Anaerolineae bacterium]|nr:hypothetical protein [Anaerolineae bacterium]